MRRLVKRFLGLVIFSIFIFLGSVFFNDEIVSEKQTEVSNSNSEEAAVTQGSDQSIDYELEDLGDEETGQASIDETTAAINNINKGYDIYDEMQTIKAQAKKAEYKSNTEEVQETQEKLVATTLDANLIVNNRGKADRKQQSKTQEMSLAANTGSSVELLDWWTAADKLFEKGVPAVVVDVETGKSFNAVRTYGSNHADVETITGSDTAVMLEIWGGEWNWERRAVIVLINGKRLAASAGGMPHAGMDSMPEGNNVENRSGDFGTGTNLDKIKSNNMDGHFDIHFINSRTHGTDKVDEKHQEMIRKAFELGR